MLEGMKQKEQPDGMLAAAKSLRGNPLSLEAYQAILQVLPKQTLPEEKVRDRRRLCVVGGSLGSAHGTAGPVRRRDFGDDDPTVSEAALQLIDHAQKLEGKPENWDPMLKVFREQAEIDIGLAKLRSKDEAVQAEGYKEVKALLPTQRFNPELLGMLGEYELKTGDKAAAQSDFADIVALPLLEGLWLKSREGQPPGDPSPRTTAQPLGRAARQ